MNEKITEIKAQFVTAKRQYFIIRTRSKFVFSVETTKGPDGWENKEHIMKPCGTYPPGSSMNTIEGKLMFMGAPAE